jgi:heme exporter protein C
MQKTHWAWQVTYLATFAIMMVALYMTFLWAPMEINQGEVQRIFYFHVPAGILGFMGFLLVLIGSIGYLRSRDLKWDRLSLSAAEVGFLFCSINLITGPIWARPTWGIWWTWDARLTLSLVLWLIYISYLMLRRYLPEATRRATLSSIMGIFGFTVSILDFLAIRWWRTQHPAPVMGGGDDSGLEPTMRLTLGICFLAMTLLYVVLVQRRVSVAQAEAEVDYLYKRAHALER